MPSKCKFQINRSQCIATDTFTGIELSIKEGNSYNSSDFSSTNIYSAAKVQTMVTMSHTVPGLCSRVSAI